MNDKNKRDERQKIEMWWQCPNCKKKVDFEEQLREVFDVWFKDSDGEAEFAVEKDCGLWFHTISCNCGAEWIISISGMNNK